MVSPILLKRAAGMRMYWNLDGNVGVNSPNRTDDVQLCQFGYSIMAKAAATPAKLKPIFAQVKVGAPCTGLEDDPLIKAIRAHQADRGGTQDGHVSVIKAVSGVYHDAGGQHSFMLTAIINNIFDAMPNDFPRIDKHPACPPALKASIVAGCTL
jgi:hypothetical protein